MKKIVIYADNAENPEKTHAGELISKVKKLHMDAEITVLGIGSEDTADHLQWHGVTTAVITGIKFQPFQEDAMAQAVIAFLKEYAPDYILIPAVTGVKSIFARAAAGLNAGMTADITEIIVDKDYAGAVAADQTDLVSHLKQVNLLYCRSLPAWKHQSLRDRHFMWSCFLFIPFRQA